MPRTTTVEQAARRFGSFSRMKTEALPPPGATQKPGPLSSVVIPISILAASDFSSHSELALDYAAALARRSRGVSVHLIHVVDPLGVLRTGRMTASPEEELAQECDDELAALAAVHSALHFPISSAVHLGAPATEIVKVAAARRADLLVVGTHGRTGWRHMVLGSVAEEVARRASCSVLVVRPRPGSGDDLHHEHATWRLAKILVPTDFSPRSEEALRYAVEFARRFGGKITLLHVVAEGAAVNGEHAAGLLERERLLASQFLTVLHRQYVPGLVDGGMEIRTGSPLAEVLKVASADDFDLMICATHGTADAAPHHLGAVAEGLLLRAPCPVLLARPLAPKDR